MTTRVLQAFDTLDNHSKSTLDIPAKKNRQLTQKPRQCFAYGRSDMGFRLYGEFSGRKKPKANEEIVKNEQNLLYKRLRKSLAVASSMKGGSWSKSDEAGRFSIRPEKHTNNIRPSTGPSMCGGKKGEGRISFLTVLKKPQTPRPHSQSPRRMAWSREDSRHALDQDKTTLEDRRNQKNLSKTVNYDFICLVEKVPSLQELTKVNRSKALVGVSLGDTDISHWCSSSVLSEVDALFKSPVPDGSMNPQKKPVRENADHISSGNGVLQNETEKEICAEPVPLSFEDLLKRKDVRVLAPRLHKAFTFEEKSSETYPVVYSTQQRHYEPFSSPGFHSLDPPSQIRKRSLRSAIVLHTEAVQARYVIRRMKERQAGFGNHRPYSQPDPEVERAGDNFVNMRVLTADGKVIRSTDLTPLSLYYPAVRTFTPTKKISLIPKQEVFIPCVGPVVNGINPSQTYESGKISPACCKAPPASPRRGLNTSAHTSTPSSEWSSSRNQMDFLSISRPVKCSETGGNNIPHEHRLKGANETSEVCVCEDCEAFSVNDLRTPHETADLISPCSATDGEKIPLDNASSSQPGTINIPTAE